MSVENKTKAAVDGFGGYHAPQVLSIEAIRDAQDARKAARSGSVDMVSLG